MVSLTFHKDICNCPFQQILPWRFFGIEAFITFDRYLGWPRHPINWLMKSYVIIQHGWFIRTWPGDADSGGIFFTFCFMFRMWDERIGNNKNVVGQYYISGVTSSFVSKWHFATMMFSIVIEKNLTWFIFSEYQ